MKHIKFLAFIAFTLIVILSLASCAKDGTKKNETVNVDGVTDNIDGKISGEPDSALLKQIEIDYLTLNLNKSGFDRYMNTSSVTSYFGTFNGAVAVKVAGEGFSAQTATWSEAVAGVEIVYNDGKYLEVWKDGTFYRLSEAYDKGFLTKEALLAISKTEPLTFEYPRAEYSYFEELKDKSVLTLPKLNDPSKETIGYAEDAYYNFRAEKLEIREFCTVDKYYGEFGGSYEGEYTVIMFNTPVEDGEKEKEVKIAGSTIKYEDSREIMVYLTGTYSTFYTLDQAYEQELLTDVEITLIAERHNRGEFIAIERN